MPDSGAVLGRAVDQGSTVITPESAFYGGYTARFRDRWHNLWWLYSPVAEGPDTRAHAGSTDWHDREPSPIYTSLMQAMKDHQQPAAR